VRVIFLTHYFPPEVGAPQARMFELAKRLVAAGDSVTVVTGFPNYPTGVVPEDYRGRVAMVEDMEGVRVVRRWVYATPNAGFARRIANHLSFAASSLTAVRAAGAADVLWVESPPLAIGVAALAYTGLKRAPFVLNVSDVWPQSAIELGALRNPAAIRMAEWLERLLYRRAARITVPTPGILEDLAGRGVPRDRLVHLTNGVDVERYRPAPLPAGRKVFMYAGTHGLAQGLDVVLEAAKLITDPEVELVLAGEGADKAALVAKAKRERIANVRFLPNQPRDAMPALLNQAYATMVTLKALDVLRHARPSKMYESMAVGRPIVASLSGEAAELVEAAGCGLVVPPEDPAALASAIERLAADPEGARIMGERARAYVAEHFSRATIARRLREVLGEAAATRIRRRVPAQQERQRLERAVDVAVALPALVLASPLIAAAAVAIKVDSRGPVLFHGPRVGRDGVPFRIHKLRTMRTVGHGPALTAGDDPRITRVGRVLRRTKLDELPQLFNVVKGDMSLVGPRPEHPDYVARYTPRQRRMLRVRPGLTGPATLAYIDEEEELRGGGAETRYLKHVLPRKLELELDYLDRATPRSRAAILLRTAGAILRRPSAPARRSRGRSRSQPG
jgi:colanic acid biosynthesis glycosyl transferase WcaI